MVDLCNPLGSSIWWKEYVLAIGIVQQWAMGGTLGCNPSGVNGRLWSEKWVERINSLTRRIKKNELNLSYSQKEYIVYLVLRPSLLTLNRKSDYKTKIENQKKNIVFHWKWNVICFQACLDLVLSASVMCAFSSQLNSYSKYYINNAERKRNFFVYCSMACLSRLGVLQHPTRQTSQHIIVRCKKIFRQNKYLILFPHENISLHWLSAFDEIPVARSDFFFNRKELLPTPFGQYPFGEPYRVFSCDL